jgi:anion-transporting  ArsA/GET3 family ATPase
MPPSRTSAPRPAESALPSPLDRPLVFVTGKGGVGKSTVAAALGLIAARRGRRTIVAELARRDDVTRALGGAGDEGFAEVELAPGLFTISIDPELAMEEYLIDQLPARRLAEVLSSSRTFAYLAAATPGLRELLALGKVWELAQPQRRTPGARPYDLVVVDAPATGHGVAFLTAARTFAGAASVGPVARQARTIHGMLVDRARTAVIAVARPTEASVVETLALRDELRAELGHDIEHLVVNAIEPRRFSAAEHRQFQAALGTGDGDRPAAARRALQATALRAATTAYLRARAQQAQVARVRRAWGRGPITLPLLFCASLGAPEIDVLSRALEARL